MRAIFFEPQGKWCSTIGAVAVLNQTLGKCWGQISWPHRHFPLPTLHSITSNMDISSFFLSLPFPLSLSTCERALHLCAAVVHGCSSRMLWWASLLWEHPTYGGCDVEKDRVSKCRDVHLDPSFPINHKEPVQGNSRMCYGSFHVLSFLLFPSPWLLPTTMSHSLSLRAAPAAFAEAEITRASLYILVHHCFVFLQVFCTKPGTKAENVAYLVGRKLSCHLSCKV